MMPACRTAFRCCAVSSRNRCASTRRCPASTGRRSRTICWTGRRSPPATIVSIWPWLLHRHRALWEDPDAFDPDRWRPDAKAGRHRFQYIPFGGGPAPLRRRPLRHRRGADRARTLAAEAGRSRRFQAARCAFREWSRCVRPADCRCSWRNETESSRRKPGPMNSENRNQPRDAMFMGSGFRRNDSLLSGRCRSRRSSARRRCPRSAWRAAWRGSPASSRWRSSGARRLR